MGIMTQRNYNAFVKRATMVLESQGFEVVDFSPINNDLEDEYIVFKRPDHPANYILKEETPAAIEARLNSIILHSQAVGRLAWTGCVIKNT